jgi:hypothetical protein
MKIVGYIGALMLTASLLRADVVSAELQIFNAQNYPGQWTLTTNQNNTVTATENAVRRRGDEVFRRVLSLKIVSGEQLAEAKAQETFGPLENFVVTPELLDGMRHAASETDIRNFIRQYKPPAIPYTSEATAERPGREKFNCVEFAEDLVAQARAKNIPAEVVGIQFAGEKTGHACAGFPTAEGKVLYFDSTPGAGEISRRAHEAQVKLGEPYRRAGGGELAGVGRRPITQITPDLNQLVESVGTDFTRTASETFLVVESENHAQVAGIEYAGPVTLQVSAAQLSKWNQAAREIAVAQTRRREIQKRAEEVADQKAASRALQEDEALAGEGDAFGELRMGERYLSGDGVKKNSAQARLYFQSAADSGSPTAAEELNQLSAPATD